MYMYVRILTRIHTCKLTYIHTKIHTSIYTYAHARMHTYTNTHLLLFQEGLCYDAYICMHRNILTVPTTGRAYTITAVLGEGALASVRWDSTPNEEHQYRCGRFGRFELVRATFLLESQPMQLYAQILQE